MGAKGKGKKGGKGKGWNNYGKSPGKSAGKSLNYWRGDDYYDAWGYEDYQDNYYNYPNDSGYVGNVTMMLEAGKTEQDDGEDDKTRQTMTNDSIKTRVTNTYVGEWDPLKHTKKTELVKTHNKYELLYDCESDEEVQTETDSNSDDGDCELTQLNNTRHRLNKRQRLRQRRLRQQRQKQEDSEGEVAQECCGWQPGPEHRGCLATHNRRDRCTTCDDTNYDQDYQVNNICTKHYITHDMICNRHGSFTAYDDTNYDEHYHVNNICINNYITRGSSASRCTTTIRHLYPWSTCDPEYVVTSIRSTSSNSPLYFFTPLLHFCLLPSTYCSHSQF